MMVRSLLEMACVLTSSRLRTARGRLVAVAGAGAAIAAVAVAVATLSPALAAGTCDLSATPSTFSSQVSAASSGQTICLASGNYGTWNGTNKAITVTAAPGASPQMTVDFGSGASGFTLEEMSGMGGCVSSGASNITIQSNTFADGTYSCDPGNFSIDGSVSNIVVKDNNFTYPVQSTSNGPNSKIFLNTNGSSPGSAAIIENNDIQNGDLDGIHVGGGSGDLVKSNTFDNLCDQGVNHTDNIQFEGGTQIRIEGNYVHTPGPYSSSGCVAGGIDSYDGETNGILVDDNVVDVTRDWGIEFYSDTNSVIVHNTVVYHDPSYSAFNSGDGQIDLDRKPEDPAGSGTQVYDNIADIDFANGSTGNAYDNISGQRAIYVGPLNTYAGFELSPNSPVGLHAASDGLDDGAQIATGNPGGRTGPPTTRKTPRLVLSFGFGEASGRTVFDSSGFANKGTIHGAKRTRHGKPGRALVFDGVDDYVSVPDSSSLNLTTGVTLEAWVRPTAAGRARRAVILKQLPLSLSYGLYANDNRKRAAAWVRTATDSATLGGAGLPLGRWSYLAATYDGSVLRVYVNGVLESSRDVRGAISAGPGPLTIGGSGVFGQWFKGTIDEVRVWRGALSASSIHPQMGVDASLARR